jgi:hypothetical protein
MARTFIKNGRRYFADSGKSVARWAAEKKIGQSLRNEEVVHHGYQGKLCNDPDNLWVFKDNRTHLKKKHYSLYRKIHGDD